MINVLQVSHPAANEAQVYLLAFPPGRGSMLVPAEFALRATGVPQHQLVAAMQDEAIWGSPAPVTGRRFSACRENQRIFRFSLSPAQSSAGLGWIWDWG